MIMGSKIIMYHSLFCCSCIWLNSFFCKHMFGCNIMLQIVCVWNSPTIRSHHYNSCRLLKDVRFCNWIKLLYVAYSSLNSRADGWYKRILTVLISCIWQISMIKCYLFLFYYSTWETFVGFLNVFFQLMCIS